MSEKLHSGAEHLNENIDAGVESQNNLRRLQEAAKAAEDDPLKNQVDSLKRSAEQQAISGKEANVGDSGTEQSAQAFGVSKGLKTTAYKKTLGHAQSQMGYSGRAFSKIIHQPAIEATGNVLAKTAARPSAVLGGGIGALAGSTALLYFAKHSGFTYNYTVFFALFIGGFFAGALIELILRMIFRKKS